VTFGYDYISVSNGISIGLAV